MTEQEEKELELFKEWWLSCPHWIADDRESAEAGWFARAKLDKERNEKDM